MSQPAEAAMPQGLLIYRKKHREFPFRLDESIGVLLCFNSKSAIAQEVVLCGCSFPVQPSTLYIAFIVVDGGTRATFDIAVGKRQYTIMSNGNTSLKELKAKFIKCSALPRPFKYKLGCNVGRIMCNVATAPFKLTDGVCTGLEKLGDRVKKTPDFVFHTPNTDAHKRFVPQNIATGLAAGTGYMIYGVFGGLIGLISEPVKGAKKKGIKGVPAGLGKGMLGLVCKPVAGTIDFVTCTIRGVNNMPRSLYRGLLKMKRKRKREDVEEKKDELIPTSSARPSDEAGDLIPRSKTQLFELAEDTQSPHDPKSVLDSLHTRKRELHSVLDELRMSAPAALIPRIESIEDGCSSFHTARMDEDVLTEAKFYGRGYIAVEIETTKKQVERISGVIGRLSSTNSPVKKYTQDYAEEEDIVLFEEVPSEEIQLAEPYISRALQWCPLAYSDDYRPSEASSKGGLSLLDKSIQSTLRSTGKEMLKTLGKKILKGDFDLTTISFPIKCMSPNTALHNSLRAAMMNPLYLNRAASITEPGERVKLVVVATLASFSHTSTFLKPLNPILGETLCGSLEDGTKLYAEQTSHHPPVTHVSVIGPLGLYTMDGHFNFSTKAHMNSITVSNRQLYNRGKRTFRFADGQVITHTCPNEQFSCTFIGTMRHESLGVLVFTDEGNDIHCEVRLGEVKGKPSDYVTGLLMQSGEVLARLSGSYMGYLDWDKQRYWDRRESAPFSVLITQANFVLTLPSDSEARSDLQLLRQGQVEMAQKAKEELELAQRTDAKLRKR